MAEIHNEKTFAIKIRESANDGSDFGTPDADYRFLYLGEDGDLHLKDAADALTTFSAGVGTSDGYRPYYDPDRPPTAGIILSDEFDNSSLDGAWSWTTAPGGTVSESLYPGYLHLDDGTDASNTIRYLRRTFAPGAAAFSVAAKVALSMENGNYTAGIGIALLDSGDSLIYYASLFTDGTTTASDAHRVMSTAATWGALTPGLPDIAWQYLLITRDATTNWVVYISANGVIWHRLGGTSVATTVAKVAIRFEGDTDSQHCEALVDFVRVFDTETKKIGDIP